MRSRWVKGREEASAVLAVGLAVEEANAEEGGAVGSDVTVAAGDGGVELVEEGDGFFREVMMKSY